MRRLAAGALAAGALMWLLGFVLYGLLFDVGWSSAPEATQLAVQAALKTLPGSGTYFVPVGETPAMMAAFARGPVAQISYNANGFPALDTTVFIAGFFQFTVVAAMIGWLLGGLGERVTGFGARARVVCGMAAIAVVYIHIADPIWYHADWRNPLYKTACDFIILSAGGLVMARWFVRRS